MNCNKKKKFILSDRICFLYSIGRMLCYNLTMNRILFLQPTYCDSWSEYLEGIHEFAHDRDWMLLALNNPPSSEALKRQLLHWRPDGCIVDCAGGHGYHPEVFRSMSFPIVYLNHPIDHSLKDHFAVCEDSAAVTRLALEHLQTLECRHFIFIKYHKKAEWEARRLRAFHDFVNKNGSSHSILSSEEVADIETIRQLPPHSGILGCCDAVAQVALQSAILAGRRIPNDLAIIGIDNEQTICEAQKPELSSVEIDRKCAGRKLAELLALTMNDTAEKPRTVYYGPSRIIRRDSTKSLGSPSLKTLTALEYIRENACNGRLSIDDVAKVMGCARTGATELFRRTTGKSIGEAINEIRFKRACELLNQSDMTIGEIIAACGYDSASYLSRYFRERTGITMREWRKTHKVLI